MNYKPNCVLKQVPFQFKENRCYPRTSRINLSDELWIPRMQELCLRERKAFGGNGVAVLTITGCTLPPYLL